MFKVKQIFPEDIIRYEEILSAIRRFLIKERFAGQIRPGMKIAVTSGGDGI